MIAVPDLTKLAVLLGTSFFLGLAYERFFGGNNSRQPGGIRTFPMLAATGGLLYLFDSVHFIPFTAGLFTIGGWLAIYYVQHIADHDEKGEPNVGLVVPVVNLFAFILGAVALAFPGWVAVGATVVTVLLLTSREKLHLLAARMDVKEITTAAEFLILTGIVLPLLPDRAVTTFTTITPRQAWLALVVVCTLSYVSYLAQRYWPVAAKGLYMAALGGLYSSTATTVVLARQAQANPEFRPRAQAGIMLASAISYLRFLVIVGVFDLSLAGELVAPFLVLTAIALALCALQYRRSAKMAVTSRSLDPAGNPLELGAAVSFAILFVLTSFVSAWVRTHLGINGVYSLAALVGVTDIDPFVLNLAQGGVAGVTRPEVAAAILIAASANNVAKAAYAVFFSGGRRLDAGPLALILLAAAGEAGALLIAQGY